MTGGPSHALEDHSHQLTLGGSLGRGRLHRVEGRGMGEVNGIMASQEVSLRWKTG
jgi:hypothetical protein